MRERASACGRINQHLFYKSIETNEFEANKHIVAVHIHTVRSHTRKYLPYFIHTNFETLLYIVENKHCSRAAIIKMAAVVATTIYKQRYKRSVAMP